MLTDEDALRTALADLTLGQPEQPIDRSRAIRRRHVRRRMAQAGVTAAVAAVAIVGSLLGVGAVSGSTATPPLNRTVPASAIQYDDARDGSVPQSVLDEALHGWLVSENNTIPGPPHTVWYVGNLVQGGRVVVAIFEAYGWLVAGYAPAAAVLKGQPAVHANGTSPWTWYAVGAPRPDFRGILGFNFPGPQPVNDGKNAAETANPDNWVLVLAPPDATRAYVPFAGTFALRHGFGVANAGQVPEADGPMQVSVFLTNGDVIGGHVGVPGNKDSSIETLAAPPPLTHHLHGGLDLGTTTDQGAYLGGTEPLAAYRGQAEALVVCRGAGTVVIEVNGKRVGSALCDGTERALDGPVVHVRRGGTFYFKVKAGPFTSWRAQGMVMGG